MRDSFVQSRRALLRMGAGAGLVGVAGLPGLAIGATGGEARFVLVILRGGMDGLSAVPAHGDPAHASARGALASPPPGAPGGGLVLDGTFSLAPELAGLHRLYGAGEMLVVHATCSPYLERSHFDGQNVLENGTARPYGADDGWLNRALAAMPAGGSDRDLGVAIAAQMPLALRGPARVTSWSPTIAPPVDADTVARIARLYAERDAALAEALTRGQDANAMAGSGQGGQGRDPFVTLAEAAARFLTPEEGPRVAVLEIGGWDTHARQLGAYSALLRNFATLDAGIAALASGLGPVWDRTVVVMATEFGRTVAGNGTDGTDHGTGGAMILAGGAVAGGRVVADWPGLGPRDLLEGRDLRPTTDMRAVLKGVLGDHLKLSRAALDGAVFPDSSGVKAMGGLLRG
ncbi:MAG: DUF1501 domain-containing protein [Alphaproteobacteria bacterium]|nr:DUF1501 domain-containing protein [Alphaproteobacteria bacterium]